MMYRVKIEKIKGTTNPYEVIYRRYDTDIPITLPTGQVIQNDPLKALVYLYNDVGTASHPQKGDQAYIMPINATEYLGFCVDWASKPSRVINEYCVGNFKTNNFIRFNDNSILAEEIGTENITFKSTVKHLVETALLEIASSTTVKIESTGGKTSLESSTNIDLIASSIVNLGGLGGKGVARIGDKVDFDSLSPTYKEIIEGSSKVLSL